MTADQKERIVIEVPEGFPAMSEPVKEENRFSDDEIVLSWADESDLLDIAETIHAAFPEVWWQQHEPLETRPVFEKRRAKLAKRLSPFFKWPQFHPIKASLRSTGEFVGFAGWHECTEASIDELHGKVMGSFRWQPVVDKPEGLGFAKLMGWSEREVDEMWEGINLETWEKEFALYDQVRAEEMGRTPHWYLSPLVVVEKFRGRGVGRMLLEYAFKRADAQKPPTPLYLEGIPNARPVYLHCGFEGREGPHREMVLVRNGRT